jgi:hypothetical protein
MVFRPGFPYKLGQLSSSNKNLGKLKHPPSVQKNKKRQMLRARPRRRFNYYMKSAQQACGFMGHPYMFRRLQGNFAKIWIKH